NYATGIVRGNDSVGGLAGYNDAGSVITGSYANVDVASGIAFDARAGGLIGHNQSGHVSISYAVGPVQGSRAEGLVGQAYRGTIVDSYATGAVSPNAYGNSQGGLVGTSPHLMSLITSSYWNIETTGQSGSVGGTGLTTAQLQANLP